MIECPFCFRVFRQGPEKLGARCPKCRMPLYEDPGRRRRNPERDFGRCEQHPCTPSVTTCTRCTKPMCQVCRTRWHEEPVCPRCVDESIADDEPSPRESQQQTKHAWISAILMFASWAALVLTLVPFSTFHTGSVGPTMKSAVYFLFLGSLAPAAFGVGYGISAIRLRGEFAKVAVCGFVGAALEIGLVIGIVVLNFWHN